MRVEITGACKKAVFAGARAVAADAKRLVPVDTGGLKNTIAVKTWERSDAVGAYVTAGGKDLGHIARFVELGTPGEVYKGGSRKGADREPIEAKPYLRPALRKNKAKIKANFQGAMNG